MPAQPNSSGLTWPRWWRRALVGARRANFIGMLEIVSALLLLTMLGVSWIKFSSAPEPGEFVPSALAATLLIGTLLPAMTLLVLIGRRLALRRAGETTARLHVRLVFFFSLVAAIPTLLVAVFASVLFQTGVEFWFSDNPRRLLENANELARGYYDQNQRDVEQETITMASDIRDYFERNTMNSPGFEESYIYQVAARELSESAILQESADGDLLTAAVVNPREQAVDQRPVPDATIQRLKAGEPIVVWISGDRIEAVTPIDRDAGIYLYTARGSEEKQLAFWQQAEQVLGDYDLLTRNARTLQLQLNLALFFVSLALVGLAIWFALRFADRQVRPLADLVGAAREVGQGNYALRVEGRTGADEIGLLNRAFNRMTAQIEQQTTDLVGANEQLKERRAFMEAVLESITAGIISVNESDEVLLMNSSAQRLLDREGPVPVDLKLSEIAPDIAAMKTAQLSSGLVQYNKEGELLTLAVKLAPAAGGYVITFEDITRQLLDQRQAAWSDVARRIAHEIKNPLTPIQLATERLSRRYRKQILTDSDLFEELTSTIIRQVGDLRKMVDEFSSFARLPKPVFRQEDAVDLVRQALFLQEVARPETDYSFTAGEEIGPIACDRHQFGQAMTNVLKNAGEAVDAKAKGAEPDYRGRIAVSVASGGESVTITVEDNGIGLPQDRERIVEPYVTTREKGTGLGLAIVNKIVEEHGGEMVFAATESGGTRVTLRFARDPLSASEGSEAAE